jgi:uncharacterized membrane protein
VIAEKGKNGLLDANNWLWRGDRMMLLTVLFTGVGLLFVVLGVPLVQRRVGPNLLYGLRVPATLADEWVWYEANAASGRDLVVLGVAQVVLAIGLALVFRLPVDAYAVANVAFLLVAVLVFAVVGWRRANQLLRSRRAAE